VAVTTGDRSIIFDNVPEGNKIRGAELSAFITSEVWSDRKLGYNEQYAVPNLTTVAGAGNQITPVGEIARRSLIIRLNANMTSDQLKARKFRIEDLESYLRNHRARLLRAALTVIVGHQKSDHKGPQPLPSFLHWSRLVRDALLWLGMPDPVETQNEETDNETENLGDAFTLLFGHFGDRLFTARDIAELVRSAAFQMGSKLVQALEDAGCSEPGDPHKLGYWLRAKRDHFGGGFQLKPQQSPETHGVRYRLFKAITTTPDSADGGFEP
jgi:hypothetical protein